MSWLSRLRPGSYPGLKLGENFVKQLVTARANPLVKYRLARVCLYYAAAQGAEDAHFLTELVLQEHLRGTSLERQQLVDLVKDLAVRASQKPGLYNLRLLNAVGMPFGNLVSESVPTPGVGATPHRELAPEAPRRIVLTGV